MRKLFIVGIILIPIGIIASTDNLSELSKLKAENLKLKTQFTQCQVSLLDREAKLASINLTSEQSLLEKQFISELKCSSGFDWSTLGCKEDVKKDSIKP